jgi:hypothetical protein
MLKGWKTKKMASIHFKGPSFGPLLPSALLSREVQSTHEAYAIGTCRVSSNRNEFDQNGPASLLRIVKLRSLERSTVC